MVCLARLVLVLGCAIALDGAGALTAEARPSTPSSRTEARPRASTKSKKRRARRRSRSVAARISAPKDAVESPAYRYAQLSADECEAELLARDIGFEREEGAAVLAPVRLTGPLRGVVFRTDQRDRDRQTSPYEIADCRLVLALDDFAEILSRHDIVEVRHYSMYRPPRSWPDGPERPIGKQHKGALAIDVGRLIRRDGEVLDVDRDFHGRIGAATCGEGARPRRPTKAALALREILCEAVDRRMFNIVLTPNYNRPHKNHFHLEVMAGVGWFMVD